MKFSKTISIERSNLLNIEDIMAVEGWTFAQVSRMLIKLGLQKYHENKQPKRTVITTPVISDKPEKLPMEVIKDE